MLHDSGRRACAADGGGGAENRGLQEAAVAKVMNNDLRRIRRRQRGRERRQLTLQIHEALRQTARLRECSGSPASAASVADPESAPNRRTRRFKRRSWESPVECLNGAGRDTVSTVIPELRASARSKQITWTGPWKISVRQRPADRKRHCPASKPGQLPQ